MSKKKNKWNDYLVVMINGDYDLDKALRELAKDVKQGKIKYSFPLRGEDNGQIHSEQEAIVDNIDFYKMRISTLNNKLDYAEYINKELNKNIINIEEANKDLNNRLNKTINENKRLNNIIKDLNGIIYTLKDEINIIDDKLQYIKDIINNL